MPKGVYARRPDAKRHPAQTMADGRLAHNRKPSARTRTLLALMEKERSCDAVAKATGLAVSNVWDRVKRWRPELLGRRYIKRSARERYESR